MEQRKENDMETGGFIAGEFSSFKGGCEGGFNVLKG